MDDWTRLRNHNVYPPYHAYALGFLRQHGADQSNGNLNNWNEAGVMDLSNYNAGIHQAYYAVNTAKNLDQSPESPGQVVVNGNGYYRDTQSSRVILSASNQVTSDDRGSEAGRAQSESPTYSDAHTSPDSWRSDSSRDESFPQADPTTWVKKEPDYGVCGKGPIGSQDVGPLNEHTCLMEELQPLAVTGKQSADIACVHAPTPTPTKQNTAALSTTKGKVRSAFSESQMGMLVQRFSVQKYLTPAEMKHLGDTIGLTYKQVKTWFQNRRMKLRRQQKDNNWMCGRNNANKEALAHGNIYSNNHPHVQPYQDVRPREHYNEHMVDTAYRKPAPQNLAFYMAAMSNAAGPAGYPTWSPQPVVPHRPQVTGWCLPQRVGQYMFNPAAANDLNESSFESQDGEPANSSGSLITSVVHNQLISQ
ncbi:homeobox protein NANOG [Betta splendens]|uniref:Homeobox protein NANOG n=1 Tax=Betta splendens TaxID=158456 RepID=A0A6P7MAY6_BETSP|nr:homeobox protein NANOG [Betta splendens]